MLILVRERRSPYTQYYVYTSTRNVYVACAFVYSVRSFARSFVYITNAERDFFLPVFSIFFLFFFCNSVFPSFISSLNLTIRCFFCHTFIYLKKKHTHTISYNTIANDFVFLIVDQQYGLFSFAICETKTDFFFSVFVWCFFFSSSSFFSKIENE